MKYKHSLVVKITVLVMGTLIVFNSLSSWSIYKKIKQGTEVQIHKQIEGSLYGISANIDGERLQQLIVSSGQIDDYYEELHKYLANCLEKGDFKYLYTVAKFEDGNFYYVVDSLEETDSNFSSFGTPLEISTDIRSQTEERALREGSGFTPIQHFEEWGYILTGYVTITNRRGQPVALLGADVEESDYNERISELSSGVWRTLLISLVGMSSVLITYLIITLKPLGRIERMAQVMAEGDLTMTYGGRRQDEIGRMANSFAHMIETIKGVLVNIMGQTKVLRQSSKQLVLQSEQLGEASEKVSEEAQGIREYSENAQQEFQKLSKQIHQVTQGGQEIAENINRIYEAVQKSQDSAEEGLGVVRKTIIEIEQNQSDLLQSSEQVEELEAKRKKAYELVEKMGRIVMQTRMLAFNANIEASKGKEGGRGFQVVAIEVERLAKHSEQVVQEVGEILDAIQDEVRHLAHTVQNNSNQMTQTREKSDQLNAYFEKIVSSSRSITQDVQKVDQMTQGYVDQIKAMNQSIQTVSTLTYSLLERGEEIMGVSQEQLGSAQELIQCVQSLGEIVNTLEGTVRYFKIREE